MAYIKARVGEVRMGNLWIMVFYPSVKHVPSTRVRAAGCLSRRHDIPGYIRGVVIVVVIR